MRNFKRSCIFSLRFPPRVVAATLTLLTIATTHRSILVRLSVTTFFTLLFTSWWLPLHQRTDDDLKFFFLLINYVEKFPPHHEPDDSFPPEGTRSRAFFLFLCRSFEAAASILLLLKLALMLPMDFNVVIAPQQCSNSLSEIMMWLSHSLSSHLSS